MITLEESGLEYTYVDFSEHTTLEKIYYMARLKPVDMVEGEDGVWRKKEERVRTERDYGHQADAFEYFYSHMYSKFINTKKGGFWTDSHPCP